MNTSIYNLQTHLQAQTPRDTTVIIRGKKFAPGVEVYYDSAGVRKRLDSTRVRRIDSRTIESLIPGWLLNVPGRYPITLQNPSPSRGVSNADTLTIARGNTPVRTDTAISFRYTFIDQYWHERIDTTSALSKADSIIVLTAKRQIKQNCTIVGAIFRDGKYRVNIEKSDDPIMADYVRSPRLDNTANHEIINIDATNSPAQITVNSDNDGTSTFTTQLDPVKDLIDTLGADPRQRFSGFVTENLPQARMTLAIARAKQYQITPLLGNGRVKITIDNSPPSIFGTAIPSGTKFIMRLDTLENYVESTELWRGNDMVTASYYKIKNGTAGLNAQYEVAITYHFYSIPASGIRMRAAHTREYRNFYVKSYLTPIPATR